MTDRADEPGPPGSVDVPADDRPADDPPTISCRRCDREWDLTVELETVGNQAFEQFALDHRRHTGHFPDGVATWRAVCRHCPEEARRLDEPQVRRWAETHVRHTRHAVEIRGADGDSAAILGEESSDAPDEADAMDSS